MKIKYNLSKPFVSKISNTKLVQMILEDAFGVSIQPTGKIAVRTELV